MPKTSSVDALKPRARRRVETTARIIDTALEIITQEGMSGLTIQRIAGKLGYAVGALYRYFPGKDALLVAVQRKVIEQLHADMVTAQERVDAYAGRSKATIDPQVLALLKLMMGAHVYGRLAAEQPSHFLVVTMILGDPRPLVDDNVVREVMLPALGELLIHVGQLFDAAARTKAIQKGPVPERTLLLWATMQGVLQLRKLARFGLPGLDADALARSGVDTMLRGLGAKEKVLADARRRCSRLARAPQPPK